MTRRVGQTALVAALACLLLAAPAAAKKGGGNVDITKTVNLPIPDATPPSGGSVFQQFGILNSTIDVGKQFKGRKVRDVNVTVQTLGTSGTDPAEELDAILRAPNGAVSNLFANLEGFNGMVSTTSIGPLTLDDEARLNLGAEDPVNPTRLYMPWAGTATPDGFLAVMDNGGARGTWTLTIRDTTPMRTSNLVSWRLNVIVGKPFLTK